MPQLIISDVMMPLKNGFEVVKELKLNARTSHIPIILLSARAERDERIMGLELGADDYLAKPFDQKELEVRIRKLIDGRSKLREIIVQSPTLSIKGLEGKPADKAFMEKLNNFIEQHYHDSSYAVELLAEQMGMSRVHLNRKLKAITNLSANKYIQKNRLNRALLLLENQDLSVAEVAIKTGFSSPTYFVKCFRENFGQTPGSLQHK